MHEFAVFALTCHEKHEKFLSSHTRSIIFQDHQIKYMRAWLESVLLTAASFGCQAIYRRMSRRKKSVRAAAAVAILLHFYYFFPPLLSLTLLPELSPNEARMENLWLSIYLPYTVRESERWRRSEHISIFIASYNW